MADDELREQSTLSQYLVNDKLPTLEMDPSAMIDFWNEVKKQAAEYYAQINTDEEILKSILEDEESERKAAHAKEVKNKKEVFKLEIQIAKAKAEGNKKEEDHLNKRLKLIKSAQDIEKKTHDIVNKYQEDLDAREKLRQAQKEAQDAGKSLLSDGFKSGSFSEIKDGLKLFMTGGASGAAGVLKGIDTAIQVLSGLVQKLDKTIEEIASYKSDWDTRLFGSESSHTSLVKEIANNIGASPFVKQADIMKNIDKAIESGISYNISQRAFLETIKDDIARTFDSFDSTLLQIVRVQQSDSTAARLGMEATLNQFLNSMYSNTEYLNSLSDSVTGALYEATSLLSSEASIGFEYQVQKWLGSLYSVGMSQQSINSIAQALGDLASGNVSSVDTGAGRLLVMSAARSSNLNYSDLLTKGIDDSQINELMYTMVNYLAQIANSNKVVQTQYANVFGLNTSDIVAAKNLQGSTADIAASGLSYVGSINALNKMAASIGSRQNMAEWLENAMDNFQYTMASGIAASPALYGIWKIANLLDEFVGGIPIPFISAMGFGVDLETTVADLMQVAALSGGLLSGIGSLISAAGNIGSGLEGVLAGLGVTTKASTVSRGSGLTGTLGETVSTTTFVGNSNASDVENSVESLAADQKNDLAVTADEESDRVELEDVDNSINKLIELFEPVIRGGKLVVQIGDDLPFTGNYLTDLLRG